MRRTILMKWVGTTKNTTAFLSLDKPAPMDRFHINSESLASAGLGEKDVIIVIISTDEFAAGEVMLAPLPAPYYKELRDTVRYQHRVTTRGGKDRPAPNTPALPVTLAYINRAALPDVFIAEQGPIFFGLAGVMVGPERPADEAAEVADGTADAEEVADDTPAAEVAGETDDAADRATFDDFLRKTMRTEEGGKLTTRRVWRVWAERCGADPADRVIAGVHFKDVAGMVREILGVAAAEKPTRVDGVSQRYWPGYAIDLAS